MILGHGVGSPPGDRHSIQEVDSIFQKSTLTENWGHSSRSSSSSLGPHPGQDSGMKYVIHKQPLSLDRFFLHEVTAQEAAASKLDNCFVLICLNRFQQIVQVHTFQADTEQLKVR